MSAGPLPPGTGDEPEETAVGLPALRRLNELIRRLIIGRSLTDVLQAVVDGVVEGLEFGVAAVNLAHEDGSFEVVAVAGSDDARQQLLGYRSPADVFDKEFAVAEHWGLLRFVPHDRLAPEDLTGWVPDHPLEVDRSGVDAWHPLDALFAPLSSPSGQLMGILSVDLPASGRRPGPSQREMLEMFAVQAGIAIDNARLGEHLRASEASFRLAFDGAAGPMSVTSLDPRDPGRFLRVNRAMCELVGYSADELLSMTFADITHADDLSMSLSALDAAVTGHAIEDHEEKRYVRRDGGLVWVALDSSVIRLDSGENLHAVTQVRDITASRAAEAELARRATHDELTGLLNRAGLHDRLTALLQRRRKVAAGRLPDPGCVLYCDLDGFKDINDRHGHRVGDRVLQVVAERLRRQVRDGDAVARLGGDEFVIVAGLHLPEAAALAARIHTSISSPLRLDAPCADVTISIGVAGLDSVPGSSAWIVGAEIDALLHVADLAMYEAKAQGPNRYVVYDPGEA